MTDIRTTLAEALPESLGPTGLRHRAVPQLGVQGEPTGYGNALLDRLLPVVEAIANQRAAEELERAVARVQAVYDLQCPVGKPSSYIPGARPAHIWWQKVLGGVLASLHIRAASLRAEESA